MIVANDYGIPDLYWMNHVVIKVEIKSLVIAETAAHESPKPL